MPTSVPLVLFLGFCGCVSIQNLKGSVGDTLDAQRDIIYGIDLLDQRCQDGARTKDELAACTIPRDRARVALRRQVDALSKLGGVQ